MLKVLIACEESQTVCKAFRARGHEAYSCDTQPCSGGYPMMHYQKDALEMVKHRWDLIIAHPPCTYLANSGVQHLYNKDKSLNSERWINLAKGAEFFRKLMEANCPRIAIENPIPHKYAVALIGSRYEQLIQPWQFGHKESKATCLWLKGLPHLIETNNVKAEMEKLPKREQHKIHHMTPGPNRTKERSKTYSGIAKAMAEQWG